MFRNDIVKNRIYSVLACSGLGNINREGVEKESMFRIFMEGAPLLLSWCYIAVAVIVL
jgi:hypothetical protein